MTTSAQALSKLCGCAARVLMCKRDTACVCVRVQMRARFECDSRGSGLHIKIPFAVSNAFVEGWCGHTM